MLTKTEDLTGSALDFAVASAEGEQITRYDDDDGALFYIGRYAIGHGYSPSKDWIQGGPIIEREAIELKMVGEVWHAELDFLPATDEEPRYCAACGTTSLIAAMRCFVISKLGSEVDVPDELIEASDDASSRPSP